ncbi:MAG: hypothetical protein ACRCXZ_00905 [Patescibacteria group bacterium]
MKTKFWKYLTTGCVFATIVLILSGVGFVSAIPASLALGVLIASEVK